MQPERWMFNFGGPNRVMQVEYWAGNKSVERAHDGERLRRHAHQPAQGRRHADPLDPADRHAGGQPDLPVDQRRSSCGGRPTAAARSASPSSAPPSRPRWAWRSGRCSREPDVMSTPSYIRGALSARTAAPLARAAGVGDLLPCRRRLGADQVQPKPLTVGDVAPMEVRMVAGRAAAAAARAAAQIDVPPPRATRRRRNAAARIDDPAAAAGSAAAGVPGRGAAAQAAAPKPQKPKPPPPKPHPQQRAARPQAPAQPQPQQAAPAAAPQTVSVFQVSYIVPPNPIYPVRARKAGEQGNVMIRVLIDVTRPAGAGLAADLVGPSRARPSRR